MAILPCLLALQFVGPSARAATVPVVTQVTPTTGNAEVENRAVVILD